MLELLSMFRPFGKWHVLLVICLLDMAFIVLQVTQFNTDLTSDQERRLQEVMAEQARVAESIQETARQFEAIYKAAHLRNQALEQIGRGVDRLEEQIARLKGEIWNSNFTNR